MAALTDDDVILGYGLNPGLPEDIYFNHPALSASGAKLLAKSPALYRWRQAHPETKKAFDIGHAVHCDLLGVGPEIVAIPDEMLASNGATSTKAAKDFIAAARSAGQVPLKQEEVGAIRAMASSARGWLATAGMSVIFDADHGDAEVSILWRDDEYGIDRRARLDWLHGEIPGPPRVIVDVKTTVNADPRTIGKRMADLDYHMSAAWYVDAVEATTGATDVEFWHLNIEKSAPYLASCTRLDTDALAVGRRKNTAAIRRYLDCLDTATWPGYPTDIVTVSLPPWELRDREDC